MAFLACHNDRYMALRITPMVTANYIVYEPLARNDDNQIIFDYLGLTYRLDG